MTRGEVEHGERNHHTGMKPYLIGEKIRALRLKKSMGLVELGKHPVFQRPC